MLFRRQASGFATDVGRARSRAVSMRMTDWCVAGNTMNTRTGLPRIGWQTYAGLHVTSSPVEFQGPARLHPDGHSNHRERHHDS